MNDAKNNLLATLENIDSTLTATRQTVQDDLTKFRKNIKLIYRLSSSDKMIY